MKAGSVEDGRKHRSLAGSGCAIDVSTVRRQGGIAAGTPAGVAGVVRAGPSSMSLSASVMIQTLSVIVIPGP